ncbi:hypothetical protein DPMN_064308 [Dreissena polymorpha]|uniref:Uncharacterized protein n=1 Tax=Dreissena polymorpha TaxID=45954 RepID=A0A9D4HJC3_DREPO|nr:hypothetical protein DPMN_064308 [Dreissena polymorpha]
MVNHVPDHVPPRFLMVDNQIPWSTIKNHGDHGNRFAWVPLGSHVFQENVTIFELIQDIIETNLLTKFHED